MPNTTGLTSISYRAFSVEEIIALAAQSGLTGIEWGGDIHVPAGDTARAAAVAAQTKAAGLAVLSYGSYYKLGAQVVEAGESKKTSPTATQEHATAQSTNATATTAIAAATTAATTTAATTAAIAAAFTPVLASALALGAPLVRVWAGTCGSAACTPEQRRALTEELQQICAMAAAEGLTIGLEYHRNTLTDCHQSAAQLLHDADCDNLYTYWQMNPDLPLETHLQEIAALKERICAVHVFHWVEGDVRETLGEHQAEWQAYLAALHGRALPYILEFVKGDTLAQGAVEAASLQALLG